MSRQVPGFADHVSPQLTPDEFGADAARQARRTLVIFDLVFFLAMSVLAISAPCGAWENRAFGVSLRNNLDPGGPYVISSVHFFDPGYPPFRTGHPGTTLQVLVWIAARVAHGMAALWSHPQLAARKRWSEVGSPAGPLPALRPVSGDGWQPRLDPVPALGEHTDAILAEFGFHNLLNKNGKT